MLRGLRRFVFERGGLIALAVLVIYVWQAPAHIVDGDNAEFSTLGAIGGIAHPSGYPSYVLWLRATSWLPGASPAHTAAIATALLAALQMLVLHAACRDWGARTIAATLAVGLFAASPFVMRIYTEAEAYALNGLVVAAVLWLAAANGPLRGVRRAAALGLIAGLGLANHLTCVLIAPVGILGLVRAWRESGPRALAAGTAALVLGLTPYLYLFVAPENLLSWPRPTNLDELLAIFTRRTYGGVVGFTGSDDPVPVTSQLVVMVSSLGRSWLWILLPVGVVALAVGAVRARERGEPRVGWIALAIAFVVAGPVLAMRFNIAVEGFGLYVIRRFHVLPTLLLVVPVAIGLDLIWNRVALRVKRAPSQTVGTIVAGAAFAAAAMTSLPHLAAVHSRAMEAGVMNMLQSLPANAVVVAHGDDFHVGTRYLQLARGVRPDVTYVHWAAMGTPWYRHRMAKLGIELAPMSTTPGVSVAEHILAEGRPLFVDPRRVDILRAFPSYPFGLLVRVLPRDASPPTLDEVVALNKDAFARFDLDYPKPSVHDEFAMVMQQRYAATWRQLAGALQRAGKQEQAAWAFDVERQLAPTP